MHYYHYFEDRKLTFTYLYGEVSSDEANQIINELQTIDLPEGGMRGLTILCKGVKTKDIKTKDAMKMGERLNNLSFRKQGKNVFITNSLLAYALTRAFKVVMDLTSSDELKIYRGDSLSQALQWLDREDMEKEIRNIIENIEQTNS